MKKVKTTKIKETKQRILKQFLRFSRISKLDDDSEIETLPIESFLDVLSFSNAQFNAPAFERRLQILHKWKKISPTENRGDFEVPGFVKSVELKTSFSNKANKINIRQIRLWQNCDYVVTYCDYNEFKHKTYFLTHDQMVEEVAKLGSATHGTKEANKRNLNVEYSITLSINNDWDKKYFRADLNNQFYT